MIKHALANRFTLQMAISTIPGVLVLGNLPYLVHQAGLSASLAALLFFLSRLGSIVGAQFGPLILKRLAPHQASASAEAMNAIFCIGLFAGAMIASPPLIGLCVFLKGLATGGLLSNFRVSWLKALPTPDIGRRIMIIGQSIVQFSYAFIGLLLITGIAQKVVLGLVLLDAATSLVAIPIFLSLKNVGVGFIAKESSERLSFQFLFTRPNLPLLGSDLSLAIAMGERIFF